MFSVAYSERSARRGLAVILLLLGAVTSSFIAPISHLAITLDVISLLFYASASAAAFHLFFMNPLKSLRFFGNIPGIGFALVGGASLTWSYVIFAWSIQNTANTFLPTFAFELYPLGIILFSNFLIRWEGVRIHQWFWIFLSVAGLGVLALDALQIEVSSTTPGTYEHLIRGVDSAWVHIDSSFLQACGAVVLLAFGMTCVSRASQEFDREQGASSFASFIARIGGVTGLLPAFVYFGESLTSLKYIDLQYILFYGSVILTISNIAYYKGISLSDTHLINVVWTLTPLFSILWLSLLGTGQITTLVGIGAACILVSNLMLNVYVGPRPSYKISIF